MNEQESKQEHTLASAFVAARIDYRKQTPPDSVRQSLHLAISSRRRRLQWQAAAVLGIAAALLLTVLLVRRHAAVTPPPAQSAAVVQTQIDAPRSVSAPLPSPVPTPVRHRRIRKHSPNQPQSPTFAAIPYAPPLLSTDQVDVYRVEMPRVTAASYGLPLRTAASNATVTADLIVGSDGIARAVRFVP